MSVFKCLKFSWSIVCFCVVGQECQCCAIYKKKYNTNAVHLVTATDCICYQKCYEVISIKNTAVCKKKGAGHEKTFLGLLFVEISLHFDKVWNCKSNKSGFPYFWNMTIPYFFETFSRLKFHFSRPSLSAIKRKNKSFQISDFYLLKRINTKWLMRQNTLIDSCFLLWLNIATFWCAEMPGR